GPGTAFDPAGPVRLPPTDFPGGPQELLLIVEAARPVPWTKPEDVACTAEGPLPAMGSVRKWAAAPMLFVPTTGRWMIAADAAGGIHGINLDATDEETLRRWMAHRDDQ